MSTDSWELLVERPEPELEELAVDDGEFEDELDEDEPGEEQDKSNMEPARRAAAMMMFPIFIVILLGSFRDGLFNPPRHTVTVGEGIAPPASDSKPCVRVG